MEPGLTICQGDVKIISLNRDIVILRFLKFLKISLYREKGDVRVFTLC